MSRAAVALRRMHLGEKQLGLACEKSTCLLGEGCFRRGAGNKKDCIRLKVDGGRWKAEKWSHLFRSSVTKVRRRRKSRWMSDRICFLLGKIEARVLIYSAVVHYVVGIYSLLCILHKALFILYRMKFARLIAWTSGHIQKSMNIHDASSITSCYSINI